MHRVHCAEPAFHCVCQKTIWTNCGLFPVSRSIDFLTKVFELFEEYDYVIITVPHLVPEFPLLQSFVVSYTVSALFLCAD